ncbi:hypothetical protein IHE55_06885 [Streptomyces pactum]|uniref:DUF1622 domain-containing protein n=1 Tax=Streptomyces pactum TaxID=68249 RepID=A0ABS0NH72_9ACTN|nr:hypothetical protein [Streptomyces pactum]MBH5334541.1 hypothetical protein [Streptomyces pactum]
MTDAPHLAAVAVTVLGLAAAVAAGRLTRAVRPALAVLLDFLTAAGLIGLSGDPGWDGVLTAAAVIALRRLLGAGLRLSRAAPRR